MHRSPVPLLAILGRRAALAASLVSCLAAAARAQPHDTNILSFAGGGIFNSVILYELDSSGQWSALRFFPVTRRPSSLTQHVDNYHLVLDDTNPFAVVLFDPVARRTVTTLHGGPPLRDVLAVRPFHTGDYLVSDGLSASSIRLVRADGSGTSTLFTSSARIEAVAQDLLTGEVLAGLHTASGASLIRIDPSTGRTVTLDPTPRSVRALVQDHRDGSIYYGTSNDTILRWDPRGGVSTFLPGPHPSGAQATALAFDRDVGNGILVAGGTRRIARIDFPPGGTPSIVAVHDDLPQNPVAATDLAFRGGRNLSSRRIGLGNRWQLALSFPGEGGNGYVLALSAAGFTPGISVGTRTLQLVPDGVFAASITGGLAPLLQNNVGTLDAEGRATVVLDLSGLGPLPGLRLWAAAATLDRAAPNGVESIGKPIVFVQE